MLLQVLCMSSGREEILSKDICAAQMPCPKNPRLSLIIFLRGVVYCGLHIIRNSITYRVYLVCLIFYLF